MRRLADLCAMGRGMADIQALPPPNYMLQQTGATGIRLCTSIRFLKVKFANVDEKAPCS